MKRTCTLLLVLLFMYVPAWALEPQYGPPPPPTEGYPHLNAPLQAPLEAVIEGSIGDALQLIDNTSVTLEDKVVTGRFSESGNHLFYIEEDDRSAGIRVDSETSVSPGDRVTVTGTLGVVNGERRLHTTTVTPLQTTSDVPGPLAMDNPTVGGAALNAFTPGVTGANGAYNKGLLVMTWGKVRSRDTGAGSFYIDDGSYMPGEGTSRGIKVLASGLTLPVVNDYVVLTGICSSLVSGSAVYRQMRARTQNDIVVTTGTTVTSPTGLLDFTLGQSEYWWALVGLPGVPMNSDPTSVFANTITSMPGNTPVLDGNIYRFEPTGAYGVYPYPMVYYPSSQIPVWDPQHPTQTMLVGFAFGPTYSAQGYWLRLAHQGGTISYQGVMEPVQSTDRYISLPCNTYTLIGNPFDHSVPYQSILVTDGKTVLSLKEAFRKNWMYLYGFWWNPSDQAQYMINADVWYMDPAADICMRPWHGYWACAAIDRLALIVPHGGQESMTLAADPVYITPGGTYELTAKAMLRSGYPMEGATISFTTTAGTLGSVVPQDSTTYQDGEVKMTLSGVPSGQSATVTATTDYSCGDPIVATCTIAVDSTGPSTPVVTDDGDFTTSTASLHAIWSASADPQTGVAGYEYAIGMTSGGTQVVGWTPVTTTYVTSTGLSLTDAQVYYISVKAKNGSGVYSSVGTSDGIFCRTSRVIHVKPDGNDGSTGLTWDTAKATVQAGINAATAPQEVWVAAGTYQPTASITLKSGVGLYGGFAATESVRADRNWSTNPTILDGTGTQGSTVICGPSGVGSALDGFVVRNNRNLNAIYCHDTSTTVANNLIENNGYEQVNGGGIYCERCDAVTITNNLILRNHAPMAMGGGMYLIASSGTIANNTIADNLDCVLGGGIYLSSSPSMIIANNIIAGNDGGGLDVSESSLTLSHNCVVDNVGYDYPQLFTPGIGDVFSDPGFVDAANGNYHLASASPCRNAGANEYALGTRDMDGEYRVQGGTVDIGADEFSEGVTYDLALAAGTNPRPTGSQITITATVTDPLGGVVPFTEISFAASGGSITPATAETAEDGTAQATVSSSAQGPVTVTASVYVDRCQTLVSKSISVYFYGTEALPADWPMFMHNAQHTGMNPETDSAPETLTLAWQADLPTASTARGVYWSVTQNGHVADHPIQGGHNWIFEHPFIDSSPIVVGNVVVVGTWTRGTSYTNSTGSVKAFDAETGAVKWTAPGDPAIAGVASTPCYYNGMVFVGSANGYLYCLDLATGEQIWARGTTDRLTQEGDSRILSSPVIHNGIVYITNEASKIYAFTADSNGTLVTGYPVLLPIASHGITNVYQQNITGTSSPAVASVGEVDYLLLGCDDGYLYRLRLSDRQLVGTNLVACVESSPTVVGSDIFVGASWDHGYNVYSLSLDPLQIQWRRAVGLLYDTAECRSTLAYGSGYLYVGFDTGWTFHKLLPSTLSNATDYFDAGTSNHFVGSAALSTAGVVYVGNDNGWLYALSAADLSAYDPTPMAYGDNAIRGDAQQFVCSSPAIAYRVDSAHSRWVYVTTRTNGGKIWAFKTAR